MPRIPITTLEKRLDPDVDTDILDELIGVGDNPTPRCGDLCHADIVAAGFRLPAFFDRLAAGGSDGRAALRVDESARVRAATTCELSTKSTTTWTHSPQIQVGPAPAQSRQ